MIDSAKDLIDIDDKEFAIIKEISQNNHVGQRFIATKTGMSLGMTNLIIRRLVKKGYIKAKQLNRKKIQYLLTPKGFSEKAKKSYNFTLRTINNIKRIRENIQNLVLLKYSQGSKTFIIKGNGELADIAEMAFKYINNIPDINFKRESISNEQEKNFVYLIYENPQLREKHTIELISYLSNSGIIF